MIFRSSCDRLGALDLSKNHSTIRDLNAEHGNGLQGDRSKSVTNIVANVVAVLTVEYLTTVALVTFLGFYWLITGVLSLVQAFVDRSSPWVWSLLSGLLGIAAGMFVLRHPLLAAVTVPTSIVIILGVEALIMAGVNIIAGFQGGGIASFIHGAFQPSARASAAGLADGRRAGRSVRFGVILLVQGVALAIWAFRVRA
jgi:uncharacterized membrane protein HdeD (DUF308 family)